MDDEKGITYIGATNYRNTNQRFGIKDQDRLTHMFVIGKSGVGKSTLLKSMAISDIQRGNGLAVIDPHGDVAEALLQAIPKARQKDLIYINPADLVNPVAFNPLIGVNKSYHHLVASGLISTFKKIWDSSWGPRLEHILKFSLLTLLCYPNATLLDIQPLLTDKDFRKDVLTHVTDQFVLSFWYGEFENQSKSLRAEAISSILNKTSVFISSRPLRHIVGQKERGIKMQQALDQGKILIVNLSKGTIGEDASHILGSMLVTSIQLAAMHRTTQEEHLRRPFYLYVDECHSFMTLAFVGMLSEARKYRLSLFLASQFIGQLDERIQAAVFGNVGTLIAFRVGAVDAEYLAKEFYPEFGEEDLVHLPRFSMYLKLMIDGATSQPFSAMAVLNSQ